MQDVAASLALGAQLVAAGDARLLAIIALSLEVSVTATLFSCFLGMPIGSVLSVGRFAGRRTLIVLFNGFMGLPPVVVGLIVYLLLSRAGPLGRFGLLFTPTAMVIAQTVLVTPIIAALTRQVIEGEWREHREQLRSLGASRLRAGRTLLWNARFSLTTTALAGFGRAIAEVGTVMIVGGNIDGVTRVMTTTIALETSKGDLPLALALGAILIAIVLAINAAAYAFKQWAERRWG
ncbi:MAG TPA: ABC transporter permease [Rhodocyclaceae bacterium]|nr:ABC transporter permease [Rhodocyclaceae bacterium]